MMQITIQALDAKLRDRIARHIANLNVEKPWTITIEPYRNRRSRSQNSLMWQWVGDVVEHIYTATGQDKDDVHEFFKQKFLQPRIITVGDETVTTWSTKNLTTSEMSDYMDAIYAWTTTELGILLSVPEVGGD